MNFKDLEDAYDVIIAGAGGVGLALANLLTRRGIRCLTLEKRQGIFFADSKCTSTQPRTVEILDEMGILPGLLDDYSKIAGLVFHRYQDGDIIRYMDVTPEMLRSDSAFDYALSCPQWKIEQAMLDDLRDKGGDVAYGVRFAFFSQDDEGVRVDVVDEETQESRSLRARYLVGCDGRPSPVREELGISREGSTYDDFFIISDIHIRNFNLEINRRHTVVGPEHHIHVAPLSKGFFRLFVTVHSGFVTQTERDLWTGTCAAEDRASWEPTLEWFQSRVSRLGLPWELFEPVRFTQYEVFLGYATRARKGRVFLAGDAGHSHTPHGGQGLNTGIQDAYNLAWKLALDIQGVTRKEVLDSYEDERLEMWKELVETTDSIKRVVERRTPAMRFMTDVVLPRLPSRVLRDRTRVATQLWLSYDDSPINVDDWIVRGMFPIPLREKLSTLTAKKGDLTGVIPAKGENGIKPGERAVDAPVQVQGLDGLTEPTRLHRLFHGAEGVGRFTLLFFSPEKELLPDYTPYETAAEEIRQNYPKADIQSFIVVPRAIRHCRSSIPLVMDREGELYAPYGAEQGAVYFVRPDRVIGYRSRELQIERLNLYLASIFAT